MSSSPKPSHPQIQVGDLVAICPHTIIYTNKDGDVGLVLDIEPLFYNEPKSYHVETFEPVRIDRVRVLWSNGIKTYEPANCLRKITKKIKKTLDT